MTSLTDQFKSGFRRHAAGVSIIVGDHPEGTVALTASSLASVSAEPPILSFSCARSSSTAERLVASRRVSVFTLRSEQLAVAAAVADPATRGFHRDHGWSDGADGRPWLAEATAGFQGTISQVVPAGASWLVLVDVDEVVLGDQGRPLVYHDRAYWTTAPVSPAPDDREQVVTTPKPELAPALALRRHPDDRNRS